MASDEEKGAVAQIVRENNQEVRNRTECIVCEDEVPDEDFQSKFAQAGGTLSGPFCSEDCYWRWLIDGK